MKDKTPDTQKPKTTYKYKHSDNIKINLERQYYFQDKPEELFPSVTTILNGGKSIPQTEAMTRGSIGHEFVKQYEKG